MTSSPILRRGARTLADPVLALVAVITLVVYQLHGHNGALSRDLSIYTYGGQRLLAGVPPYVSVLNRAGPLAHMIPALGIGLGRLFGVDDVHAVRLFFMVIATAAVCAVYLFARDVFRSRTLALVAATAMLSFHGFVEYAADGPREKTPMVLFFMLSLWALHHRRWFAAGCCISLATLCLQIMFPGGAAAMVVALLACTQGGRLKALGLWVVGGAVPVLALGGYFAAEGALHDAIQAFWVINEKYTQPASPFVHFNEVSHSVWGGYGSSLVTLAIGLLALLLPMYRALRRRGSSDAMTVALAGCGAAAWVEVAWAMHDFNAWPDAFPMLPTAAIGIGVLAAEMLGRASIRTATAVLLVACVAMLADTTYYSVSKQGNGMTSQRLVTRAITEALPSDATYFTYQAPMALVFAHKAAITRYMMFDGGLQNYMQDSYPGGLAGFARWVAARRPTVILATNQEPMPPSWLLPTLQDYQLVGKSPWDTYVRLSVPASTRHELRHRIRGIVQRSS